MFFLTIHDAVLHILLKKDMANSPKVKLAQVTLQFPSLVTLMPSLTGTQQCPADLAMCPTPSLY